MRKEIIDFLLANGFFKTEDGSLANGKCIICHVPKDYIYEVRNDDGSYYTKTGLIYELIGYLTYYDLMPKDFNTLRHEAE